MVKLKISKLLTPATL